MSCEHDQPQGATTLPAKGRIFVGHIAGLRDIVGFHGSSVEELETAFREAVDDYIAACKVLGQRPDKPYSGRLMFRVDPQVHADVSAAAQVSGLSLNQWAEQALRDAAHRTIGNQSSSRPDRRRTAST